MWPSHLQNSSLSTANLALEKARSRREPNLGCRGLTDLGDVILCQKSMYESCRMGRRIVSVNLICSLCHCECDGHTVHKVCQRRLTADWLAPRESDCLRLHNKVSSDWLPSYIKATPLVLEILRMFGYFLDSPRIYCVNGSSIPEQTNVGICRNVAPCALVDEYQLFAGTFCRHEIFAPLRSYSA